MEIQIITVILLILGVAVMYVVAFFADLSKNLSAEGNFRIKEIQMINNEGKIVTSLFIPQKRGLFWWYTIAYRTGLAIEPDSLLISKPTRKGLNTYYQAFEVIKRHSKVCYNDNVLLPVLVHDTVRNCYTSYYYCPSYYNKYGKDKYYYVQGTYEGCTSKLAKINSKKVQCQAVFYHTPEEQPCQH